MSHIIYREIRFGNSAILDKILRKIFPRIAEEVESDEISDAEDCYAEYCDEMDRILRAEADRNCRIAGF